MAFFFLLLLLLSFFCFCLKRRRWRHKHAIAFFFFLIFFFVTNKVTTRGLLPSQNFPLLPTNHPHAVAFFFFFFFCVWEEEKGDSNLLPSPSFSSGVVVTKATAIFLRRRRKGRFSSQRKITVGSVTFFNDFIAKKGNNNYHSLFLVVLL